MTSALVLRRAALTMGAAAVVGMGILAGAQTSLANPGSPSPSPTPAPSGTGASSVAPVPVDCTDPNNQINCQNAPIDSPMVPSGVADPGSPWRD